MLRSRDLAERKYGALYRRYLPAWGTLAWLDGVEYQPCFYCGDPAEEVDHAFPISQIEHYDLDEVRELLITVPACHECNGLAGATVDPTLDDRRDRIHFALRVRYRKLLDAPGWTEDELAELEGRLRDEMRFREHKRQRLRQRLREVSDA